MAVPADINVYALASCQVWEAGLGHCGQSSKHLRKFGLGTLNVITLRGRVCKVMETLSHREVDGCCIQETRYRSGNCRTINGKRTRNKLYWSCNDKGTAAVVYGGRVDRESFEVQRVSVRIILVVLPLRISGTTSRLACSRQLRVCLAQIGPAVSVVKRVGGCCH